MGSCFRRRTNIICTSNSYQMRSIPPNVLAWSKKHRRTQHLPESASSPGSTEPPGPGTGSLCRLKPRTQERSESAMQNPFPELINEPGRRAGAEPTALPASPARRAEPGPAAVPSRALGPPAPAPHGGTRTRRPGPPVPPAPDTAPTCSRCSSRKPR